MFFSSHLSLALSWDDQTWVRYAGQPARSPPYSSRLPTAVRSARSAPRLALPPPYILPAKDSALLLLPTAKKRSRFKAPRRSWRWQWRRGWGSWRWGKVAAVEVTEAVDYQVWSARVEDAGQEGFSYRCDIQTRVGNEHRGDAWERQRESLKPAKCALLAAHLSLPNAHRPLPSRSTNWAIW